MCQLYHSYNNNSDNKNNNNSRNNNNTNDNDDDRNKDVYRVDNYYVSYSSLQRVDNCRCVSYS